VTAAQPLHRLELRPEDVLLRDVVSAEIIVCFTINEHSRARAAKPMNFHRPDEVIFAGTLARSAMTDSAGYPTHTGHEAKNVSRSMARQS